MDKFDNFDKMENKKAVGNQKKPRRFNIIDFMLIVLIIAAMAILIYILLGNDIFSGSEDTEILYTIEIELIKNDLLPAVSKITPGTKLTETVRHNEFGEVQKINITEAYSHTTDSINGVARLVPYPDHSKVTIVVKAKCKKEDPKYIINGKTIMVGIPISFRTTDFIGYGKCVYIEEINEGSSKVVESDE